MKVRSMKLSRPILVCCLIICTTRTTSGQQSPSTRDLLRQLQDNDWAQRAKAFGRPQRDADSWSIPGGSAALLDLLKREEVLIAATLRESHGQNAVADKYGEEYGEYEADVLETCVKICDKGQLLSFMLSNTLSDLSPIRHDALAILGDVADRGFSPEQRASIDSVLFSAAGDKSSWFIRTAAVNALGARVQRDSSFPSSRRARVHEVMVAAVSDPEPTVRQVGIRRLGEIGDARDLPISGIPAGAGVPSLCR